MVVVAAVAIVIQQIEKIKKIHLVAAIAIVDKLNFTAHSIKKIIITIMTLVITKISFNFFIKQKQINYKKFFFNLL